MATVTVYGVVAGTLAASGITGVQFPLQTRQAGWLPKWIPHPARMRRRAFQPGRGQEWDTAAQLAGSGTLTASAAAGVQFPLWSRQGGPAPKWAPHVLRMRGRAFQAGQGQAQQGGAQLSGTAVLAAAAVTVPSWRAVTRQAGWSPRWAPHILRVRSRAFQPGWGQMRYGVAALSAGGTLASQAVAEPQPPLFTRQAGWSPRWAPDQRRMRGRVFQVGWGPGNQGADFALFTDIAGHRPRWQLPRHLSAAGIFLPQHVSWQAAAQLSGSGTMTAAGQAARFASAQLSGAGRMAARASSETGPGTDLWDIYLAAAEHRHHWRRIWEMSRGSADEENWAFQRYYAAGQAADQAYAAWLAWYDQQENP